MKQPLVSIIIPNNNRDISGLLQSIEQSTYKNYEILHINQGLERSAQRNIGIKQAKGDYLLILDSDQYLTPELLEECVSEMLYYDSLYIPEQIPPYNWFAILRNFERQFYNKTSVDCVRFVKAKDCPLFDETLHGPEDSDFDRRIKGRKGITYNHFIHHDNIGFWDYCKKKAYYAKSMRRFAEKNKGDRVLSLKYRCFTIFVENNKWRRLVNHPLLTLGVIFILGVRGVIWLLSLFHPQD